MKVTNRESLKKHCEEMCRRYSGFNNGDNPFSEHRLVLDLLEQTEWVPYNEFSFDNKLPEEGESVLLCSDSGEMVMTYGWYPTEEKDFWIWGDICNEFGKVVAWMPLPKPYKKDVEYIF